MSRRRAIRILPRSIERALRGMHHPPHLGRLSNRDRIARAAEEARIGAAEKAAKKAPENVRMKVVWEVCDGTGRAMKSFPYPERERAEAETQARTRSTGRAHILCPTKVPMDDES